METWWKLPGGDGGRSWEVYGHLEENRKQAMKVENIKEWSNTRVGRLVNCGIEEQRKGNNTKG